MKHDPLLNNKSLNNSCEKVLGNWLRERGVRDQAVLITKGAHTPYCHPEYMHDQLEQSLEGLQTDYVDLYLMHRDNSNVPVGEFVDVLHEFMESGRVHTIGVSNWTVERWQQAQCYAREHRRHPLQVLSNQFSLPLWRGPMWPGCVSSRNSTWQQWLTDEQVSLMAWSSQAQGSFAPEVDGRQDATYRHRWFHQDNDTLRLKAIALADRYGVQPQHVALRYVLQQPFPTFALIGPQNLQELRDSLHALTFSLTHDDIEELG